MSSLPILALLIGIVWLWLDGMRARERATRIAEKSCKEYQVQLLDGTVALVRLRIALTGNGLRLRRVYSFEFSGQGDDRRSGQIVLLGTVLEYLDMDHTIFSA